MQQRLQQIFPWLVGLLVFCIPSNLFLVLNENQGYVNGFRIDYLIPKLFLTDLLAIVIILLGSTLARHSLHAVLKKIFTNKILLVLVSLLIFAQCFAIIPAVSFFTLLKCVEYFFLLLVLALNWRIIPQIFITAAVTLVLAAQAIFASYQHLAGRSLTPYWLFGESQLNESMIGLARGSFNGAERLLAYGTTPHPNILAGITVLLSVILISQYKYKKLFLLTILMDNILIIFLTQSWSALLALLLGIIGIYGNRYIKQNIVYLIIFCTLLTPFFLLLFQPLQAPSITRRIVLNNAALHTFVSHPVIGVGLGNFTAVVEKMMVNTEFVRFIQPTHNVAMLLLAETGLVGILLGIYILRIFNRKYGLLAPGLALIPLCALDHYLITTQVGMLGLLIFLLFFTKKLKVKD